MKIETKALKAALDNLRPLISRRLTLPILSCVKLHTERNRLHLTVSNLDEHMVEKIECEGEIKPLCVSFNHLHLALIGNLDAEITPTKNNLVIKCGSDETVLATLDAEEFPPAPDLKTPTTHGAACADLSCSIKQVCWAASDDSSRYILNSVFIESSDKNLTVVATNGRELAIVETPLIGSKFTMLVPREFVANFYKILERGGAILSSSTNQIKVSHDNGCYICKQMEGNYPNFRQVIPQDVKPLGTVITAEFLEMVSGCGAFSSHSEAMGRFIFSKKELGVEFRGDGEVTLSRHLAGVFKDLTIGLSTKKMIKIFSQIKTDETKLFYVDEFAPLIIEAVGQPIGLRVITMPMRLS